MVPMDYRTLGRTGCAVSTLTLGTMTFGKETDEAGAHAQLDAFFEAGGNLVDTADVYNAGASEEIIGRWLAARPAEVRDRAVVATKGRFPMGDGRQRPRPVPAAPAAGSRRLAAPAGRRLRRPLPGALLGPGHPARGDAGHARRHGAGRQGALRRAVELHRLAGAEDRRARRAARLVLPGHPAAAVQPAGPRAGVGDRAVLPRRRPRPAALVPARRRLADRQVREGRATHRCDPPRRGPDPRRRGLRPALVGAAHLGRRRRGARGRGRAAGSRWPRWRWPGWRTGPP